MDRLQTKLNKAVGEEDYEAAAQLRDRLEGAAGAAGAASVRRVWRHLPPRARIEGACGRGNLHPDLMHGGHRIATRVSLLSERLV